MTTDVYTTQPHYVDHLLPVWRALGDEAGAWTAPPKLHTYLRDRGVEPGSTSDRTSDRVLTASWGDAHGSRRSWRRRALMCHGAGQSYVGVTSMYNLSSPRRDDVVSLFLMPNEQAAEASRASNPRAGHVVVGTPKLDAAFTAGPPTAQAGLTVVSHHWNCSLCPETHGGWPRYAEAVRDAGYSYHVHPRIEAGVRQWCRKNDVPYVEAPWHAEVLVADNTSVAWEFMAVTGRPVVWLDLPEYRRDVEHGVRFWSLSSSGVSCTCPGQLPDAVVKARLDEDQDRVAARERAVAGLYPVRDGTASTRAAEALLAW